MNDEPTRPAARPTNSPAVQLGVYQLLGPLGKGGMGVDLGNWHTRLKRPVAVKALPLTA